MTDRSTYTDGIRDCDVCHKRSATHVALEAGRAPTYYCDACVLAYNAVIGPAKGDARRIR